MKLNYISVLNELKHLCARFCANKAFLPNILLAIKSRGLTTGFFHGETNLYLENNRYVFLQCNKFPGDGFRKISIEKLNFLLLSSL